MTNIKLPYRWDPQGTTTLYHQNPPPGALIALAHRVWRVITVRPVPEDRWTDDERDHVAVHGPRYRPYMVIVRPVHITDDDPRARDHDLHLRARGHNWHVYPDEHYPVCAHCAEPLPCREQMAARLAKASLQRMERYSTEGVCPACQEPITARQKSITFSENLEIPGGPPVTYHLRGKCRWSAVAYERRWVGADPERRRWRLSCPGFVINHNDGTYECTQLTGCPGPQARHPHYVRCRCPDCHARGNFDCHPASDARLVQRDVS